MNRKDRGRLLRTSAALALAIALATTTFASERSHAKGVKRNSITILYSFKGGTDGAGPNGLFMDAAGNLYGTTVAGGASDNGTVFKLDSNGNETVLYSFRGGADGQGPMAGVVMDSSGNLYGTTQSGGPYSGGIAFKVDPSGNETVLHRFGGTNDGATPLAGLIRDHLGNLYGTTSAGGPQGGGTVFKLDPKGKETVLWSMAWPGPAFPFGGLMRDAMGNLYGTTTQGGTGSGVDGTVFKIDPKGNPTTLYEFGGPPDGDYPEAGVIRDNTGNLYGTTEGGGSLCNPYGCGTVFKLTRTGNETVLHSFNDTGRDGAQPTAGVARDKSGNLYGTTPWDNTPGYGTVFKLDTAGKETVLYRFKGGADGRYPQSGLIIGGDGNLYGTTTQGGDFGNGVVWRMAP